MRCMQNNACNVHEVIGLRVNMHHVSLSFYPEGTSMDSLGVMLNIYVFVWLCNSPFSFFFIEYSVFFTCDCLHARMQAKKCILFFVHVNIIFNIFHSIDSLQKLLTRFYILHTGIHKKPSVFSMLFIHTLHISSR